jgi:creatinine amidohydrolase
MILQHATWPEVETYLQRSRGILIPLGSTEQHGPTGLIGTDSITAETVACQAGDLAGALVGPTLTLGPAQFNLAFPGTICLRPTTMIQVLIDYVHSLARGGFRQFYLLNGHGGNLAPVCCAVQELHAERSLGTATGDALQFRVRSWWDLPEANALRQQLYGAGEGMHATPSEIAITQHVLPALRRVDTLPAPQVLAPEFLRFHAGDNHPDAERHRAQFPDGRVGSHSGLARPEHGQALLDAAARGAAQDYADFLRGEAG